MNAHILSHASVCVFVCIVFSPSYLTFAPFGLLSRGRSAQPRHSHRGVLSYCEPHLLVMSACIRTTRSLCGMLHAACCVSCCCVGATMASHRCSGGQAIPTSTTLPRHPRNQLTCMQHATRNSQHAACSIPSSISRATHPTNLADMCAPCNMC